MKFLKTTYKLFFQKILFIFFIYKFFFQNILIFFTRMLHLNYSILSTGLGSLLLLLGCNHHVPLFTPQVTHCSMNNFFITDLCFFCIKVFYYIFACFFLKCISESFFWSIVKVQILYLFFFSAYIFQYLWILYFDTIWK